MAQLSPVPIWCLLILTSVTSEPRLSHFCSPGPYTCYLEGETCPSIPHVHGRVPAREFLPGSESGGVEVGNHSIGMEQPRAGRSKSPMTLNHSQIRPRMKYFCCFVWYMRKTDKLSPVAQAGLELAQVLNLCSFCVRLPSAKITSVHHHIRPDNFLNKLIQVRKKKKTACPDKMENEIQTWIKCIN